MQSIEQIIDKLFVFFPIFFIGMWLFVLKILSVKSGWSELEANLKYEEKFEGTYYRFQSARINTVNFNSSLEIGVNEKGLFMVPMILFRFSHKPLFFPWSELRSEPFKKFWFKGYRITHNLFPHIGIELSERVFNRMAKYINTGF